ncbi:SPOR domain-containing protein [Paracoccus suum]|uniref:SPOR domain-containing protein n=1 Tax=Paracoccus suum TaxID=2259340 RepID=A0A344PK74_9RHOB|nr:SPOR domain-containing protein [Paracoccus suum]AXC49779.1 SPOR domain-containing protein [Paracoccus suum]
MTTADFRLGGFDDGYPGQGHSRHRGYDYDHTEPAMDHGWDDPARYSTDAEGDVRAARDGMAARIARLLNYVGALVSVALMVGLLVWGYRLVTRDVSGVPVIRALQGEARVAPEEPGGEMTKGTGLAVNAIAAGEGIGRVGKVEIAPQAAGLAPEDAAMGTFGATARTPGALAEVAPTQAAATVIAQSDAEARAAREAEATRLAAEQEAAAQAQALAAVASLPETTDEPAADAAVDSAVTDLAGAPAQTDAITNALAEAAAPAVAEGPRPQPRPQRRIAAAEPTAQPAPEAEPIAATVTEAPAERAAAAEKPADKPVEKTAENSPEKPAAAAKASGKTVVQIGAFDSDKLARGEWARVAGKNGGLFAGKDQVVQKTERNGRTFWRLRVAGFGDRDEARAFCAQLKSAGTDCIPTASN